MKLKLIYFFFFLVVLQLYSQTADSSKGYKIDYAIYPMAFYTPETEFAAGAGGMIYTRLGLEKYLQPSNLKLSAYYTTNHQYSISAIPTLYFGGSAKVISESKIIYSKEISKFYGIGNNTPEISNPQYEVDYFRFYTELGYETGLINNLHVGLIYEYSNSVVQNSYNNPELNSSILGAEGGATSGLGVLFIVDNRDNIFFPTKNQFFKARFIYMQKIFGSDFNYERTVLDYRQYFNLGDEHIIATQVYGESTTGDVPFFKLPMLGGAEKMRGYFLGRYRDKNYLTFQVEYRKMVWWRLGVVAFVGMGDVAKFYRYFKLSQFKYSYGFGFRFAFDKKEKLNVRMDAGFGSGTDGIYFSLEEAF